jgi:hypothetical protein
MIAPFRTGTALMAAALLCGMAPALRAQAPAGTPIEYARRLEVPSRVLGETRPVDVALPTSYATAADQRYPLLVVLDGESQHLLAAALVRFFASAGQLPEMIVVGVPNTDRTRDLSPPMVEGFAPPPGLGDTFGGGDRFLAFLGDELVPLLERDYRTVPMRVLVGHSIGGTFALFALARRPGLFTGYVVMDPAAWWNRGREQEDARAALARPEARRTRLMLVRAPWLGVDTTAWGGSAPMVRYFDAPAETHVSVPATALTQALRAMFADFLPSEWRPGTRPFAMLARLDSLSDRVGYAVPVPDRTYSLVTRMSLDSRFFDDAERVLDAWERAKGPSEESGEFRRRLGRERSAPAPAGFVPLEIPARRPSPSEVAAFLGRWVQVGRERGSLTLEFRPSGDTVVAWAEESFEDAGQVFSGPWHLIQVTADGTLEVGAPYFRGLAALLVHRFQLKSDGTLEAMREPRGYAPQGEVPEWGAPVRFRRAGGEAGR